VGAPVGTVVVKDVEPGSVADEAGLSPGDILLQADGVAVHSPADVDAAVRDGRATLLVRRGESQSLQSGAPAQVARFARHRSTSVCFLSPAGGRGEHHRRHRICFSRLCEGE